MSHIKYNSNLIPVQVDEYASNRKVRIETVTDNTTIDSSFDGGEVYIATDAKILTLGADCPVGMQVKVVNTGANGAVLVSILPTAGVGVGGRNEVINGTSSVLTAVAAKKLLNTKATALKGDYAELTKTSATTWDAVTYGIWTKEG